MAEEKIENWQEKKEKLKKEFPQLNDDDVQYEPGQEVELLKKLQEKLKQDRHDIRKWLSLMG